MKRGSSVRLMAWPTGEVGASSTSVIEPSLPYADAPAAAGVSRMALAAAFTASTMLW